MPDSCQARISNEQYRVASLTSLSHRRVLASLAVAAGLVAACAPVSTSTCGAGVSVEQCEQARAAFRKSVAAMCRDGELTAEAANRVDSALLPWATELCRQQPDELFYRVLANEKCKYFEEGGLDDSPYERVFDGLFGWSTSIDELHENMEEGLRSACNEFRNGRMSGRDVLHQEGRLSREFDRVARSTWLSELWDRLTLPLKAVVAALGVIATVFGILASVKSIAK